MQEQLKTRIEEIDGEKSCLCGVLGCTQVLATVAEGQDGYDQYLDNILYGSHDTSGTEKVGRNILSAPEAGEWRFCLLLPPRFSSAGEVQGVKRYIQNLDTAPLEQDAAKNALEENIDRLPEPLKSMKMEELHEVVENLRLPLLEEDLPVLVVCPQHQKETRIDLTTVVAAIETAALQ
jgi:hypothetical protein